MRTPLFAVLAAATALSACQDDPGFGRQDDRIGVDNPANFTPPKRTDEISQVTTPKVDILWVIDNSCSMADKQAKLADNFPLFIEFFLDSGLDWHVGVVSTDMSDPGQSGRLQGAGGYTYIDPESANPSAVFASMATLGTNGSGQEQGRDAAYAALTDPLLSGPNRGFYREEASLHLIAISDEEDQSNDVTRNEFISFLSNLKDDDEVVTFSSITGPNPAACSAQTGANYHAVTNAIGGITESICEDDWAPVLEELGLQAAGLRREYFLSDLPVRDTLKVWVTDDDTFYAGMDRALLETMSRDAACKLTWGDDQSSCFTFNYDERRNSVIFEDFVPSPLAQVSIDYTLQAGVE